jgi:hypothetical protein
MMSTLTVSITQRAQQQQRKSLGSAGSEIRRLRLSLYQTAGATLRMELRQDGDVVKCVRDEYVRRAFPGRTYADLNEQQLRDLIQKIRDSDAWQEQYHGYKRSRAQQIRENGSTQKCIVSLRGAMIALALEYCELINVRFAILQPAKVSCLGEVLPRTEQIFEGEQLRFQLRKMWQGGSRQHSTGLPNQIIQYLFEHYINAKLNQMLCEIPDTADEQVLNDRRDPELIRNWNAINLEKLQTETVRYLLNRVNAMLKNLKYGSKIS